MRHHSLILPSPLRALGIVLLVLSAGPALVLAAAVQAPAAPVQAPAAAASLDQILSEISGYNGGIDSSAWWKLREHVYARKDDPVARAECEARLLRFLETKATPEARMAACRLLRVIASDTAVPALQAMLSDRRSADLALYVLQQIPGAPADRALLQAVSSAAGTAKVAVIAAVGERRMAAAVPALVPLLRQPEFARASALALGGIGDEAAARALVAAYATAPADLKPVLAAASARCAERALAAGNAAGALRLYETLLADPALAAPLRQAVAIGRISAAGDGGTAVVLELLNGSDAAMQQAAISRVPDVIAPQAIAPVCALLPRLPEESQVALLAALASYPADRVLPTVLEAARGGTTAVRLAALKALETTGDASVVPALLETAAKARGPEQAAARTALGMLKGRAVDDALLAQFARKPAEDVELELLTAVAERRIYHAKTLVAASLASTSAKARVQALKALRTIGTPSDIPAVLDLLLESADEAERSEAEATLSALAQKVAGADGRAREVRVRLASEKEPEARARLIGLLPIVGDSSTLPLLRAAMDDRDPGVRDAAVRAMTAWPTAAARDDIFRLARDVRNETHRLLAIRGLVRIIDGERYRDPESAVADLRLAAGFSWRPEEQKLILGALAKFACRDALSLATGFLREPDVKAEAQAAVDKIQAALK